MKSWVSRVFEADLLVLTTPLVVAAWPICFGLVYGLGWRFETSVGPPHGAFNARESFELYFYFFNVCVAAGGGVILAVRAAGLARQPHAVRA